MSVNSITDDPYWPRASEWLEGAHDSDAVGRLAILGAPLRLGSITPGRCDLAPQAIRQALARFSTYHIESSIDVRQLIAVDLGDLDLAGGRPEETFAPLVEAISDALKTASALVLLGGDNSITRPGCHGASASLESCGLLTLDAPPRFARYARRTLERQSCPRTIGRWVARFAHRSNRHSIFRQLARLR